jgi:hypothetical protein
VAAAFDKEVIKINLALGKCDNLTYSDSELLLLIGEAADRFWNTAPHSRLILEKGSQQNVSNDFKTEPLCTGSGTCTPNPLLNVSTDILISCNQNSTNFPNTNILGKTLPINITGTTINGALFLINDTLGTEVNALSRTEMVALLAHEIGHAVGLGHSPVKDSLMYYQSIPFREFLGQDDIDGISYLYPKRQPDVGCGNITYDFSHKNFMFTLLAVMLVLIGISERKIILKKTGNNSF